MDIPILYGMTMVKRHMFAKGGVSVILLFAYLAMTVSPAYCQIRQTTFQRLTIAGDKPYSSSTSLTVDPYGFLWVGTISGLHKYDGASMATFQSDFSDSLSLPANRVSLVCADGNGNIYVQCVSEPLHMLFRTTEHFHKVAGRETTAGPREVRAADMVAGSDGAVWIATNQGVCRCAASGEDRKPVFDLQCHWPGDHPLSRLEADAVRILEMDNAKRLWISTGPDLYRYDTQSGSLDSIRVPGDGLIRDIFQAQTDVMYVLVTGQQRLWRLDPTTNDLEFVDGLKTMEEGSYLFGATDALGNLWISELAFGIHHLTVDGRYSFYSTELGSSTVLTAKYIWRPATDYAGNVWWPSDYVYKIAAFNKRIYVFSESFRNMETVSSIYREDDILWIGTLGGGLLRYDLKADKYVRIDKAEDPSGLPDERVYFIEPRAPHHLVLLTRGHLVLFDKQTLTSKKYRIASGPVRRAIVEADGAWVTISSSGIRYVDFSTGEIRRFLDGSDSTAMVAQSYFMHQDEGGDIWLCTIGGGLVRYTPATGAVLRFEKDRSTPGSISSNTVHMMAIGQHGKWWLGTNAGLNIFDPRSGRFELLSSHDGLVGDDIKNVAIDHDGMVWVTAGEGMNVIDPETREIRSFGFGDGLTNQGYYPRSIYVDREGVIYIGGDEGLNFFHPSDMGSNSVPPRVWISRIERPSKMTYDQPIELLDKIVLTPDEGYVNVGFASTQFTNPEGNTFSYRLAGLDDQWVQLGHKNNITLAGLQPGDYMLEVSSTTQDGVISEQPARLRIEVLPPFYKTWWFYALVTLLVGCTVIWLSRYRIQQLKKEAAYKQKLAETEMQALRSQMNPHFLFNSLNSIKSYIASNEPRHATNYLTKFAQLMRHILNHSKEEHISLADELKALELYIQLEHIRFENKFSFCIDQDDSLELEKIAIQPLIIQPFVENAIWHGLVHLDRPGQLSVRVKDEGASIRVEVEDNGVGRAKAAEQNSKSSRKSRSYGMQITRERLQTRYAAASDIEIIDLHRAEGEAAGTLVKVTIPKIYLS